MSTCKWDCAVSAGPIYYAVGNSLIVVTFTTTLKHIGLNAKGFKQSSLYIAELLSDADTVSISETWLRPLLGALS